MDNELMDLPQYDITSLDPKQQRFIHLYLTGQYSIPKLAELIGVHYTTLKNWLKRTDVKNIIASYQQEEHEIVQSALKALNLKAVERLSELMDSPIDGVALQAVNSALDRGGHKAKQEVKKDITVTTYEKQIEKFLNDIVPDYEIIDIDE